MVRNLPDSRVDIGSNAYARSSRLVGMTGSGRALFAAVIGQLEPSRTPVAMPANCLAMQTAAGDL